MGMYVVVDIWWNNGDNGCNMVRMKTWWKPYLTFLLKGIFLSFEL
jgi:hypothetical protein